MTERPDERAPDDDADVPSRLPEGFDDQPLGPPEDERTRRGRRDRALLMLLGAAGLRRRGLSRRVVR